MEAHESHIRDKAETSDPVGAAIRRPPGSTYHIGIRRAVIGHPNSARGSGYSCSLLPVACSLFPVSCSLVHLFPELQHHRSYPCQN